MSRFAAVCALSLLVVGCEKSPIAPSGSQHTGPPQGAVTFTLSGRVTDSTGNPVQGAQVQAVTQGDCPDMPPFESGGYQPPCTADVVVGTDDTDTSGEFSIVNLPTGYLRVDVTNGVAVASEGVSFNGDSTVAVVLR